MPLALTNHLSENNSLACIIKLVITLENDINFILVKDLNPGVTVICTMYQLKAERCKECVGCCFEH